MINMTIYPLEMVIFISTLDYQRVTSVRASGDPTMSSNGSKALWPGETCNGKNRLRRRQKKYGKCTFHPQKNKLRWYPQQLQRFLLTNLSEACWSFWSVLRSQALETLLSLLEPDLALHQKFPKPSPGTHWTCLGFSPRLPKSFSRTFSGTLLNLTWLCTKASQTFCGTFSGTLLNLLRNPVETWPGSAPKPPRPSPRTLPRTLLNLTWLHQSLPDETFGTFSGTLLNLTWLCTKASQTFSGTFFGTVLNLTGLCTKASRNLLRNLLRNPVEPDLALHQSLPDLHRNLLRNPVEPDPPLHQSLAEPSPEPSPEPCWTWPVSAPKPPRPSPEPSEPPPEPCWTWPAPAPILGWRPH